MRARKKEKSSEISSNESKDSSGDHELLPNSSFSFNANNTMDGSFNCQLLQFDIALPGKINFQREEESQNGFFSKETSPWTPPSTCAAPVLTSSLSVVFVMS